MFKLFFHLVVDFGDDLYFIADNELDLETHLTSLNYTNISFYDLKKEYGRCTFKTLYGQEEAKCFYIKKI